MSETSADGGQHQNIARMSLVLSTLAAASSEGARLVDVMRGTGLAKTVTHRCLAGLVAHGLAVFDDESARFYLGDRVFAWSVTARERFALAERIKPYLLRLARETEDTAYFAVRRGDETVCLGRGEGSYPIKTLTLSVGERRLLGGNTGGLAIISCIDDREVDRILATHRAKFAARGLSVATLRKLIAAARANGHSAVDGQVVDGMSGVGVALRDRSGKPVAAVSVAAITPRLQGARRLEIVALLGEQARLIERELASYLSA